ncbi:Bin3-domain-containing protein [Dacryopinax primogenitus]|uniref:RNA methyltransferase n=1 Tax=Dacryopinax primogenitus (strain DJM 731) TaxID=1858805 RepID=M5FQR3_DACPD|nr:Bin3-domain-containing protein [Dacryopinax primogenitus]EJT97903.1 Bin3-domain-containing protein [Dacryopinax primogenitus]
MERNHTPQHGNFHKYYLTRPTTSHDPRLALLPPNFFKDKRVLDVGCNEGLVTLEIAQEWGAAEVLGVDVDEELVTAARERRRLRWSLQHPEDHDAALIPGSFHQMNGNVDSQSRGNGGPSALGQGRRNDHFPASMPHMFGPLPLPPAPSISDDEGKSTSQNAKWPYNVSFRCLDYSSAPVLEDEKGWDVILLLSVAKWLHLNGGDQGLLSCFKRIHDSLRPHGALVLELQDWEGYRRAARGNPILRETYKTLSLRPSDFKLCLLQEVGFQRVEHLGISDGTSKLLFSPGYLDGSNADIGELGARRRAVDVYYKVGQ